MASIDSKTACKRACRAHRAIRPAGGWTCTRLTAVTRGTLLTGSDYGDFSLHSERSSNVIFCMASQQGLSKALEEDAGRGPLQVPADASDTWSP